MTSKLLSLGVHIFLLAFCLDSDAAVVRVSFQSRLAASPITVPAFGSYETDVLIRRGTFASGSFLVNDGIDGDEEGFAGPVSIHLENFLFFNEDNMMALQVQNEGWSALPTDWAADLEKSFVYLDASGSLQFELLALRGLDRYSQNRPFGVIGDVGGTHDLQWIAIDSQSTTWNTAYVTDRVSSTSISVTPVPEPAPYLMLLPGLLTLRLFQSRHKVSHKRKLLNEV